MKALRVLFSGCMLLFYVTNIFAQCYFHNLYRYEDTDRLDDSRYIKYLSNGNFLISGGTILTSNNEAVFVIKVNQCGDTIWQRIYDYSSSGGELANSILELNDNKIYLVGRRYSPTENARDGFLIIIDSNGIASHETAVNLGHNDLHNSAILDNNHIFTTGHYNNQTPNAGAFLAKLDSAGNVLWRQVYDTMTYYYYPTVNKTFDGGYVLSGRIGPPKYDLYLIKTDDSGNLEWEKEYGDNLYQHGGHAVVTRDSGYTLVGHTEIGSSGSGQYLAYLIKTNATGDTLWTRKYGTSVSTFRNINQLPDGSYIIAGDIDVPVGSNRGVYLWIVKLNEQGNMLWQYQYSYYGGRTHNYVEDMTITPQGDIALTGYITAVPPGHTTGNDMFILKVDSCGYLENDSIQAAFAFSIDTLNKTVSFTNESLEYCTALWYFGDGDSTYTKNPVHTYTEDSIYNVMLVVRAGNSTDTIQQKVAIISVGMANSQRLKANSLKIYPNPNDGRMTLEYEMKNISGRFVLYDISGKELTRITLQEGKHKVFIEQTQIENGVYVVRILKGNEQVHVGKVVIIK